MNAESNNQIRKFFLYGTVLTGMLLTLCFGVSSSPVARAQGPVTPVPNSQSFTRITRMLSDGKSVDEYIDNGPPTPPPGYELQRAAVALPKSKQPMGTKTLTVPAFNWVFGCTSVSAAMIAGYYDRNGFPNMYTGPTNGGVMPLDNSSWGTWSDGYATYPNLPLAASHNGVDGRVTRGSIDDYWVQYGSSAQDPYITNGWTEHTWGDAIGDYMKTSQLAYGNRDGHSRAFNWGSSASQLTCSQMETLTDSVTGKTISTVDSNYGRKLFYQARGYTVTDCYNQKTDNNSGGFTFALYKAEIDAGRPVLLHIASSTVGHAMVGVGYDDSSNTVYLHDTWDYNTHQMTWGGSYSGMSLTSVSIVNLAGNAIPTITSLNPSSAIPGGSAFTLTVDGTNYVSGSVVRWNGSDRTTTYVNSTQLTASIPASDIAAVGSASVTVFNPAPGGGTSNAATFSITYPVPTITGLNPGIISPGGSAFTLTVNGTNYVSNSVVRWNASNRTTTYVSSTRLTATIPASDIATAGSASVTVFNPTSGLTSSAATFWIGDALYFYLPMVGK
jgi:hypothetical protein